MSCPEVRHIISEAVVAFPLILRYEIRLLNLLFKLTCLVEELRFFYICRRIVPLVSHIGRPTAIADGGVYRATTRIRHQFVTLRSVFGFQRAGFFRLALVHRDNVWIVGVVRLKFSALIAECVILLEIISEERKGIFLRFGHKTAIVALVHIPHVLGIAVVREEFSIVCIELIKR